MYTSHVPHAAEAMKSEPPAPTETIKTKSHSKTISGNSVSSCSCLRSQGGLTWKGLIETKFEYSIKGASNLTTTYMHCTVNNSICYHNV
jgi:hypothetical protein